MHEPDLIDASLIATQPDTAVSTAEVEGAWLDTRLQLRDDLVFRPQQIAGQTIWVVEDPLATRFYRLGQMEYLFAAALDGQRTIRESLQLANQQAKKVSDTFYAKHTQGSSGKRYQTPITPLSRTDALTICQWAIHNQLLTGGPRPQGEKQSARKAATPQRSLSLWNPILFRLPGFCPEPWLARMAPYLSWLYTRWATRMAVGLVVFSLMRLLPRWELFTHSWAGIISPTGPWSLLACWVGLKILHEVSHGMVCRRYGGEVREAGLLFVLFVPLVYVDVTSSWRFRSKWQRIHTAAAGMQLEIYVAALAAILWSYTAPGIVNQTCAQVVWMASLTTILFNANPLMRFDGYYILTDLLEQPNLYVTGQSWLHAWGRKTYLGLQTPCPVLPSGRGAMIRGYAILTFAWRLFICGGLIMGAASLWHGAGIVLAVLAIGAWYGVPLFKLSRLLFHRTPQEKPHIGRLLGTCSATLLSALLLAWLPWPGARQAPAIVQYDPLTVIRASSAGFIKQVRVGSGEPVTAGQVVVIMENRELQCEQVQLELEIQALRLRARGLLGRHELAAWKATSQECVALEKQQAELRQQLDGLTLRAPRSGRVVTYGVNRLVGQYVQRGDPVIALGDERHKQIQFSVAQNQLKAFQSQVGQRVVVAVAACALQLGALQGIEPRASRQPISAALCTPTGGTLVVQEQTGHGEDTSDRWELLEPQFTGTVDLSSQQSLQLRAGQRATVGLGRLDRTLGEYLFSLFDKWLKKHLERAV